MIEDYCTSERQRPRKFLRCTKYWHIVLLNFKWYQASFRLVMPGNAGIDDFLESTMEKGGWVYIMTKHANGTFYIGVTSDLIRPISQHRDEEFDGFAKTHELKRLVYFERHDDILAAISRKKP